MTSKHCHFRRSRYSSSHQPEEEPAERTRTVSLQSIMEGTGHGVLHQKFSMLGHRNERVHIALP